MADIWWIILEVVNAAEACTSKKKILLNLIGREKAHGTHSLLCPTKYKRRISRFYPK